MGAVYIQLNNSIIEKPITHDYRDPSILLGVSGKVCRRLFTSKFPSARQATKITASEIYSEFTCLC